MRGVGGPFLAPQETKIWVFFGVQARRNFSNNWFTKLTFSISGLRGTTKPITLAWQKCTRHIALDSFKCKTELLPRGFCTDSKSFRKVCNACSRGMGNLTLAMQKNKTTCRCRHLPNTDACPCWLFHKCLGPSKAHVVPDRHEVR